MGEDEWSGNSHLSFLIKKNVFGWLKKFLDTAQLPKWRGKAANNWYFIGENLDCCPETFRDQGWIQGSTMLTQSPLASQAHL